MRCDICKGACCESFILQREILSELDKLFAFEGGRWLRLHASESGEFECPCTALSNEGRCIIYEDRPTTCKIFEVGGADCIKTVRARRTNYAAIMEEGDPD
jgi:Fe-S-cluster containining protein